jgi:hypothetical protein
VVFLNLSKVHNDNNLNQEAMTPFLIFSYYLGITHKQFSLSIRKNQQYALVVDLWYKSVHIVGFF